MKKMTDQQLEALLRQVKPEKAPENITDDILEMIISDAALDDPIAAVLKSTGLGSAPMHITGEVMSDVLEKTKAKPPVWQLRTRWIWIGLPAVLVLALLPGGAYQPVGTFEKALSVLVQRMAALPPLAFMVVSILCLLLVLDYWWRSRSAWR